MQFDCIITHVKLQKLKGPRYRLPARQRQIIKEKLQRLQDGAIYYNDDYLSSEDDENEVKPKVVKKKKGKIRCILSIKVVVVLQNTFKSII